MNQNNLIALILIGGKSKRMGEEKFKMTFNQVSQIDFLIDRFQKMNIPFLISCNRNQFESLNSDIRYKDYLLKDSLNEIGPMNGLISALSKFKNNSFLLVACDMPLITEESIKAILLQRDATKQGTVYKASQNRYEPLFAIYESKILTSLTKQISKQNYSFQHLIKSGNFEILPIKNKEMFKNINDQKEFNEFKNSK